MTLASHACTLPGMKILTRAEFLALPAGVIYSEYKPIYCTGLFRKGDTSGPDYYETSLVPDCWNGDPPSVDDGIIRNGMFEADQLYAVFEAADLEVLRGLLADAVAV